MIQKMCHNIGRGVVVSLLLCSATLAGGWKLNPQPKHKLPYGHPIVLPRGGSYRGHPIIVIQVEAPKKKKSSPQRRIQYPKPGQYRTTPKKAAPVKQSYGGGPATIHNPYAERANYEFGRSQASQRTPVGQRSYPEGYWGPFWSK